MNVRVQGFEELPPQDNGRFDVAASNIPFGGIRVFDPSMDNGTSRRFALNSLHNYFFVKGLDAVREGGIVAFITSQGVMNSAMGTPVRRYLWKGHGSFPPSVCPTTYLPIMPVQKWAATSLCCRRKRCLTGYIPTLKSLCRNRHTGGRDVAE